MPFARESRRWGSLFEGPSTTVHALADLSICVLVLAVVVVTCLTQSNVIVFKARATELISHLSSGRSDLVEHYALSGDWDFSTPDLQFYAASAAPRVVDRDAFRTVAGSVGGVLYAAGSPERYQRSDAWLMLRPVVSADDAEHNTVMWLCGDTPTPVGWSGPASSAALQLPRAYQFHLCRAPVSP